MEIMFSQTEIAKQANVSKAHISQIVNGKNRPSPALAKRLAALFPSVTAWEWIENPKIAWNKVNNTSNRTETQEL